MPVAEAARVLAGRFGCSVRQARRYAEHAARAGREPRCRRRRWCSRSSCRPGWPGGCARMPGQGRPHHLRGGHPGAGGIPGTGSREPSPQVNTRRVEAEFVFDRHSATDLSVAYAILVPQQQARIGRPGQEDDHLMTSAAISARVSSARQKKDQTIGSQTAALRAHAVETSSRYLRAGVRGRGHSDATLVRPALEALRDLAAQAASTWCCATRRTGWPASSPTRRC